MKKILPAFLCIIMLLCSCSKKEPVHEVNISFEKIAAANSRARLLEKYGYITERTASRKSLNENFSYWIMHYEKDEDSYNAILDYSADYKCYYYKGGIYNDFGDGELKTVVTYRENYNDVINTLLMRTDTLSYVFITNSFAIETDEGFEASFDFVVNNDIVDELKEIIGANVGETVRIKYELDKDYIIRRCKYYRLEVNDINELARIDVEYGVHKRFPQEVVERSDGKNTEFVNVNIIEDFGTSSQYTQTFKVKKGTHIIENDVLWEYYMYKDPVYSTLFEIEKEVITKDTDIFIISVRFADMLKSQQEYMENMVNGENPEDIQDNESSEIAEEN